MVFKSLCCIWFLIIYISLMVYFRSKIWNFLILFLLISVFKACITYLHSCFYKQANINEQMRINNKCFFPIEIKNTVNLKKCQIFNCLWLLQVDIWKKCIGNSLNRGPVWYKCTVNEYELIIKIYWKKCHLKFIHT